jgi:hypothetical protein
MVGGYHYLVSPFGINWFDDTSRGKPKSEHTQLTQSFEVDRLGLWNPKNRANEMYVVASGEIPIGQNVKGAIKNDGTKMEHTRGEQWG